MRRPLSASTTYLPPAFLIILASFPVRRTSGAASSSSVRLAYPWPSRFPRSSIGGQKDRQLYRLLFFEPLFPAPLGAAGARLVPPFLTSSTTSCHQCSSGPVTSPSSWRRVSANRGSLCHSSQSARVFQVPMITRLLGFSSERRSCPPTHPCCFLAPVMRDPMTASHFRSTPSFSSTFVTIVTMSYSCLICESPLNARWRPSTRTFTHSPAFRVPRG